MVKSLRTPEVSNRNWQGLLFIGDPHVENRQPGFRKDDYPQVVLDKLKWCLGYAKTESLLPVFLGDLFEKPRENSNWMIGQLMELLYGSGAVGIYGNHDCADPVLSDRDSLALLIKAGCYQLLTPESLWRGEMNGCDVILGGSSYRQKIPTRFDCESSDPTSLFQEKPFVFWITHHDIETPGYDAGRHKPKEIENVHMLVNGHIHRRLDTVVKGQTSWVTPGSISRRSRSDANRLHVPSVLQVDVVDGELSSHYVVVPHQPFDEVFHTAVIQDDMGEEQSDFISGLKEMLVRKTSSGAGLAAFLEQQLTEFSKPVADEILALARQVEDE